MANPYASVFDKFGETTSSTAPGADLPPAGYKFLTNKNGTLRLTNKDGTILLLGRRA